LTNFLSKQDLDIDLKEFEMLKDPTNISNILKKSHSENLNYPEEEFNLHSLKAESSKKSNFSTSNYNVYSNPSFETSSYKHKNSNPNSIPEKNKLFAVKVIIGDKNSLYRAVSESILESEEDYMMIKFFIANFASRKSELEELYNSFCLEDFQLTFFEYLNRIKDDYFLVGEFDLIMLSKILNIELTVYSLNPKNNSNKDIQIDYNNEYNIYSNLKIMSYSKCQNPFYTIDLLYNNLEDVNDLRNTYHLLSFNKSNPFYKKLIEKKNDFNAIQNDLEFYDITELQHPNYIRDFYFSNYTAPPEVETKVKSRFSIKLPKFNINEDIKLTVVVIVVVLAFLTLRRMF